MGVLLLQKGSNKNSLFSNSYISLKKNVSYVVQNYALVMNLFRVYLCFEFPISEESDGCQIWV
jgi:hypothetical protein